MNYCEGDEVTYSFVLHPVNGVKSDRWTAVPIEPESLTITNIDGEEETFDFERIYEDNQGFTVHALCIYTKELPFTHGAYVYAWDVYLESEDEPGCCMYCESFSLDQRDFEAEDMEIWRIADAYIDEFVEDFNAQGDQ